MNSNTRRLITSALPYVNNVPHLGNLIQMLSADVFARFCRSRGYDTLYVCGTDEYGTATETRAKEDGKTPQELCDYYYALHTDIYNWFDIAFDKFGRTSNGPAEITQNIFLDLDKNGFIKEHTTKQLFCPKCQMFLADRYVNGTCPKCGSEEARGDQCDKCGALLDPTDLQNPRCSTCGTTPEVRETKHLYIDLPGIAPKLEEWMAKASVEGKWSDNALRMAKAWIRDGLNERAITRDLKWGIPVPKAGYENKVFYVWFDAPIGYISITKQLEDELKAAGKPSFDYRSWWLPEEAEKSASGNENSGEVKLFQFIGKDNIPFHTVIFPCSLLGGGRNWTKLYHMSSTEFLNYEDGKFSKSRGVGVFGTDAKESGIKADAWRFYIFYNRPEKSDYQFTWKDFQERYNGELIGNLGNLVNRTLLFVNKYYDGKIPEAEEDAELWKEVREREAKITELLEWAELRDAFREMFAISDICNKKFQATEPWKTRNTEPEVAAKLIHNLCYVIKDLMIMMQPYMPQYTQEVMSFFGKTIRDCRIGVEKNADGMSWKDLGITTGFDKLTATSVYFTPLDNKSMLAYKEKFSGKAATSDDTKKGEGKKQEKKAEKKKPEPKERVPAEPELAADQPAHFNEKIKLVVAKIVSIDRNPESDKLYVEHLDDGSGNERIIQSGLVPYLREDELLGKHIILAANLAPRKMRGITSHGMLLAADYKDADGKDCVEVLTAPWAAPGTEVVLEGASLVQKPDQINADDFFAVEIKVSEHNVVIADKKLVADGKPLVTEHTVNGEVH